MIGFNMDMIVCIQYCVISAVCALSLVYFIVVTNRSAEHSDELLFYKLAIGFAALCALTDIMYALREYRIVPFGSAVSYTGEILYSLGSICGAYCWFVYSEMKQKSPVSYSAGVRKLCAVPFAVMCLFTLTTPLHGLCFAIEGTQYARGVLNVPFTALCTAFVLVSGITAMIGSFRKKHHANRVLLRMLFLYAVMIAGAQLLQTLLGPILPFRSLFAALLFMVVTLRGMCETVTADALTHINNRFSLNRLLDAKLSGNEPFGLLMIDIDDFKQINDTYGHVNGDEAIIHTAEAVTRAVPAGSFAARYGGDEFAVVLAPAAEAEGEPLEQKIRAELKRITVEHGCPYSIDITAGYAKREKGIDNIPDMIAAADSVLYDKKRAKKARG
ncbi:MAG: GGDEF domain-containing protein [Clostridia bacterium]|nr:GGDEF domain-containing protein [Clostridia bacterium]